MKRIFKISIIVITATVLLQLPGTIQAQERTPLTKEHADNYYINCKAKRDPRMSVDTQNAFCACTSAHMMKHFSVEEAMIMNQPTEEGRAALNKMLIYIYAPCMEMPVRDLIYNRCVGDEFKELPSETCECVATSMAQYTTKNAQNMLAGILKKNPDIYDPMQPIVTSKAFTSHESKVALACIKEAQVTE